MVKKDIIEKIYEYENELKDTFKKIDNISFLNSMKVLKAFHDFKVSTDHLHGTTGYGYNDTGRDIVEKVYSDIFHTEASLVRNQFISASHALYVCLFGYSTFFYNKSNNNKMVWLMCVSRW